MTIPDRESSHVSRCCTGLIKAGLLQQLFVGAARLGTTPSSTCAERSNKDCDTDHTCASVAYLHSIFKSYPFYEPPHSLLSSAQFCLHILSMDENHTKQQFGFRAFSNSAPRLWHVLWVFFSFSQETQDPPVFKPVQPSIFPSFSLFVFCAVYHLAKRLPQ